MGLRSEVEKLLAPLRHKIQTVLSKAIVEIVKDSTGLQVLQVSLGKDEIQDGLERLQEYGFSSHPHPEAEAIVGFINGNRNQGIVLKIDDHRYRVVETAEGTVTVYSSGGNKVQLLPNGKISITANAEDVSVNGSAIKLGGSNLKKLIHEDILSVLSGHTHACPPGGGTTTLTTFVPPLSAALHATTKVTGE
jgi:phage gp45-like